MDQPEKTSEAERSTRAWHDLRRSSPPAATTCNECGHTAAEVICHVCKTPRPHYAALVAQGAR